MARKHMLTCLLAAAVALPILGSAGDKNNANFLAATGKDMIISAIPGQVICAGGVPTGQHYPFRECSEGTNRTVVRGEVETTILSDVTGTGAAFLAGTTNTMVVNCNLDSALKGPCWGTFEMTVPGQGKWEGTWQGNMDLVNFVGSYSMVAQGSGDRLEGKQMRYEAIYDGTTYSAVFTARINGE